MSAIPVKEEKDKKYLSFLKRTYDFYVKMGSLSDVDFKTMVDDAPDEYVKQFIIAGREGAGNGGIKKYQLEIEKLELTMRAGD